ncbi:meiotic nuclear division protein 1 [Cystobasidium minutum MCA 4210]|uniref:meiotic nuclear division protein 1 n=1 Tax=Cystobasidium minutum MCA 4210 TaxID=1397322 RepID=UPI0034CD8E7B|eukprot:jgi/Rhomi1/209546/estExt_Genemark1.C_3_t10161
MSSKKAGTSAEEKAAKLLSWFHDTKDFYSLKEVEKAGVKATGISGMIIKDILQTLIDDNAVLCEKVGTSNYYWSYPGATAAKVKTDYENTEKAIVAAEKKLQETQQAYESMKAARGLGDDEDQEERDNLLKDYAEKQAELQSIKDELSQYAQGDPAVYEQKKKDIELMKESALRWTDQISTVICYARDHLQVEPAVLVAHLELPENYEDLTFP